LTFTKAVIVTLIKMLSRNARPNQAIELAAAHATSLGHIDGTTGTAPIRWAPRPILSKKSILVMPPQGVRIGL